MEYRITIVRPAGEVFAFLADPANIRHWLPRLRRDDRDVTHGGLQADREAHRIGWAFEREGTWRVAAAEGVAELTLALDRTALPAPDPTRHETAAERIGHAAQDALQSVKCLVEAVAGGDPTTRQRVV
jgi:uncharacterized protein YndB with AHSA1/START domain